MEKKFLRKLMMVSLIVVLAVLSILVLTIQIVNAEESSIDAEPILQGVLEKYINYNISEEDKGTLMQYHLKTGINYKEESEVYPVKENEITIQAGQIDGEYPYDAKVIMNKTEATNGNMDDHYTDVSYNPDTGVVTIDIHNQDENGNMISDKIPDSNSRDDYVLIFYYHTYVDNSVEREVSLNISSKITLFTDENKEIHAEGELKNTVTENIGEVTSVEHYTEDIYNGFMKSNAINQTEYNTQYADIIKVDVSKKEAHQKIKITEDNTFIRTNGEEIIEDLGNDNQLVYKTTKFEKQNILELLGEDFQIEILNENDNILATINKDTPVEENGSIIVTYENDVKSLHIKTSYIVSEGTLYIENTKEIKNTMTDIENVDIKTATKITGVNEEVIPAEENDEETQVIEKEVYTNAKEDIIAIQEANNNVDINISSSDWTNKQQNEVTFDIHLNATTSQFNLFKNPQLKIELPSQVEKVILGNSSIVYGNGLELQEPYVEIDEDGKFSIVANLVGEQTQYTEKDLELITDVKISATIILKKDIQNVSDKINFVYTNAYTLNGQVEENSIQKDIKIQSYNQEKNVTDVQDVVNTLISQQNTDSLNVQVTAKKGDITLNDDDIVYEGEYIKYSVRVTNITDTTLNDVKIVGSVPDGVTYGELEADYYSYNGEYKYNFDDNVTEKTIDVGTLESGKTVEVFYEVKVDDLAEGEEQKEITTNIKSYVGNSEASNWELSNVVNSSSATIFVDARRDNGSDRWNYNVYLKGEEGKEVTVQIKLPEEFTLQYLAYNKVLEQIPNDYITVSEDNVVTATLKIDNSQPYAFEGDMEDANIDKNTEELGKTLIATASVTVDDKTYSANETRIFYEFRNASVTMTSPTEGQEIAYEEEIEYNIKVKNTGGGNSNQENYRAISVELTDFLPEDIKASTVTYETYEGTTKEVVDEETGIKTTVTEYNKKEETIDISGTSTDENGNRLPNVDLKLTIPYGESVNITIKATAGYVYEKTAIENNATITLMETRIEGDEVTNVPILNKTSNTITHTILPTNNANLDDPDNPENPDNPDSDNPDNPDSDNPDNPNPDDSNNPGEGNYNISGVAWVDHNEDGERQSTEQLLSGITVMLLDTQNVNTVKAQKETDSNGAYSFTDLESGQYIVVFRYDSNNYELTEYKKNGISENVNSDVSNQEITIGGEKTLVGATDILTVENNVTNVDIGLVENKLFDLRLDKSISKVTVQTNQKTSTYGYDNEKLVKVDIRAKEIEGAKVTVEYKIIITNEGELTATVGSVSDYLPDGFNLSTDTTQNWIKQTDGKYVNTSTTNQKIEPGKSMTLTLTATKTMTANNTGIFINKAEIEEASSMSGRQDMDSTPGNSIETEDDFSKAEIIISIGTGIGVYISIGAILAVLIVIGIILGVKKGKIKIGKISKMSMFMIMFIVIILSQSTKSFAGEFFPDTTTWDFDADTYYAGGGSYFDGPLGRGYCIDHGIPNQDTNWPHYKNYVLTYEKVSSVLSESITSTGSVDISKGSSNVTMKQLDSNNYILGPFVVRCSNSNGYTIEVKDNKGNTISGISTCDSNGNNITVAGNATFYIKISAANCKNGISKVKLTNSASVTVTKKQTVSVYGEYSPASVPGTQRVGIDKVFDRNVTSTTTKSDYVEWKDFNGALDIVKQDADDANVKLAGVQIRVQNATVGYDKTFTTDANGKIHIDNLQVGTYTITEVSNNHYGYSKIERGQTTIYSGKITAFTLPNEKQTGNLKIYKKDADNNTYALPGVSFKIKNSSGQYIIGVDTNGKTISRVTGTVHLGDLKTTTNINNATEFITDDKGCIQIYNLLMGTYTVSEISIGDNFGYEVDNEFISWECNGAVGSGNTATVTINRQTSTNTGSNASGGDSVSDILTIKNRRKYIKIRGFAWEEKTDGKNSTKDYIWNDGTEDRRLANIPVRLINANGETIDQAYTDANGEYAFGNYDENENATKLKIEDLVGAHIEFAYNGMSYQSIAVDPNFVVNTETRENGNTIVKYAGDTNKATDEALREDFNNRYATISKDISSDTNEEKTHDIQYEYDVTNHKSTVIYGDNVQYGYEGQTYPISGVYDQYTLQAVTAESDTNALCTDLTPETIRQNAVEEIGGLNLGVEERIMPDLAVVEDMDNVEIRLNGYSHTYQYARRYDDPEEYAGGDPFNVGVKFASKYITNSYSREVYSSDVVYNHQEGGTEGKLEIYITYRLQLRNESSTVYTKLKTLANYYDKRYAEVLVRDDQFVTNNEGIITEYGEVIRSEVDNSYHQNGMKKANIYTDYDIAPGKTREITITYKLGNEAVNSLLNQDLTLDSITEVTKYSSYSDDQYTVPYAGIDVDSAADTINPSDYINSTEDDTDKAPSVILTLKDERFIKGTVWEDGADPDLLNNTGYEKERRGDGIYEETTENVVKDVKVELLTVTGSGEDTEYQLAKIYQYDEENKNESVLEAETKTDEHGNYEFVGVIPSNYVLRYTYEDMSILCDKDGNILLDEEGNTKYIDADNYKSTIYRGGDKEAVENMDDYWYREETSKDEGGLPRYSDAKDNDEFMNNRLGEKLDGLDDTDITYGSIIESETTFKSVSADTRKFDMKIEYDVNKDNISKYGAELKFEFDHIDFGIIERPKQYIDVNKEVSNIQIKLTNGNDLINGDPHSQPGVRVVDDDVYIEIDNEIIQGATLIVTYGITVDNTACEIDYNTDDYYIYGIWPDNREEYYKIATVTDMFDYLPEDLVFQLDNATNEGWELVNDITDKNKYEDKVLAKEVYKRVEERSNIIHLTDEGAETFDLKPGKSATKYIVASKQLSTETDDLTYENDVEVVKLTGVPPTDSIPGNYDPTENETYDPGDPRDPEYPNGGEFMDENEPDCDDVEVTITPPTGGYKQYLLYGILGFSVLMIIGVGIVIIKKKVL